MIFIETILLCKWSGKSLCRYNIFNLKHWLQINWSEVEDDFKKINTILCIKCIDSILFYDHRTTASHFGQNCGRCWKCYSSSVIPLWHEILPDIPRIYSAILLKLLSQSSWGRVQMLPEKIARIYDLNTLICPKISLKIPKNIITYCNSLWDEGEKL